MRVRTLTTVTAVAATALLLAACGQGETRDESGEIVTGGDTDVFSIAVGDCFNDVDSDQITELPTVPCAEAHDNEVYAEYTFTEDEYPGDDVVQTRAQEECLAVWEEFVGVAYESSALEVFPITPTEGSWNDGNDRLVSCAIWDPAGQVTGSLAGAAR
ncbi:hypothetical protein C8046_00785 [Serinibacter arcticus]|uniref:Septum formation-related domain-containing protein n=1 Tax=Serinibacter arcticus TaxID=1655435 RepID=A0A2U1ZR94_9MICO|nr:septum formation family protein [Serinibacter arcticus]PWD49471.1 hypothetical protein C8046_00785 [Serinibacter arcticus]